MEAADLQQISEMMDSKLEPIKNAIVSIETNMHTFQKHLEAINNRLYKMEERLSKLEIKLDLTNTELRRAMQHPAGL